MNISCSCSRVYTLKEKEVALIYYKTFRPSPTPYFRIGLHFYRLFITHNFASYKYSLYPGGVYFWPYKVWVYQHQHSSRTSHICHGTQCRILPITVIWEDTATTFTTSYFCYINNVEIKLFVCLKFRVYRNPVEKMYCTCFGFLCFFYALYFRWGVLL